ncbi:hypothetical protein HYZ97_02990 [Candidatus Pacearchaeota archaeon]|nr:hypothetical protein [Candidatus Pacearchaeota archaeon]
MVSKGVFGGSAIIVGVLIALTELLSWPAMLNYLWALLVLIWGFMALGRK